MVLVNDDQCIIVDSVLALWLRIKKLNYPITYNLHFNSTNKIVVLVIFLFFFLKRCAYIVLCIQFDYFPENPGKQKVTFTK